jgi:excisionase family DNA binding protein
MDEKLRTNGYIRVRELAKKAGVGIQTVYHWLDEKKIEEIRVGAARYVQVESAVKYLGVEASVAFGLIDDVKRAG